MCQKQLIFVNYNVKCSDYYRCFFRKMQLAYVNKKRASHKETLFKNGGEERTRTADLLTASQAL